jgi:hypothetical protein
MAWRDQDKRLTRPWLCITAAWVPNDRGSLAYTARFFPLRQVSGCEKWVCTEIRASFLQNNETG